MSTTTPSKRLRTRSRFDGRSSLLAILLAIIGISAIAYPVISTLHNNAANNRIADQMSTEIANLDDGYKDELVVAMRDYNESLRRHPVLPGIPEEQDTLSAEYQRYANVGRPRLLATDAVAEVTIPAVDIRLPVYRGSGPSSLNRGAGHMFGTTLPVGGPGTNTAITAHTGLATASMFDNLVNLKVGQDIYITTLGQTMRYRMVSSKVVAPDAVDAIPPVGESDADRIFLITCTPYGLNHSRLIVEAHRIALDADPKPKDVEQVSNSVGPWQTWMTVVCVLFVALTAPLAWLLIASKRRSRRNRQAPDVDSDLSIEEDRYASREEQ